MLNVKKILLAFMLGSVSISVISAETTETKVEDVDLGSCTTAGQTFKKVHTEERCSAQPSSTSNEDLNRVTKSIAIPWYYRHGSTVPRGGTLKVHTGIDIGPVTQTGYQYSLNDDFTLPKGAISIPIYAAAEGVIVATKKYYTVDLLTKSTYGNFYLMKHFGMGDSGKDVYSLYIHMVDRERETVSLDVGTIVKKGEKIGEMYNGGTSAGPNSHLHYSIQYVPDIYEFNYYSNVYPLRNQVYKSGDDKSVTIEGKKYEDVLDFLKENYEDPEEFYYNHNANLVPDHPYLLAKKLEEIQVIPEFLNAETCASMWNEHITSASASKDSDTDNYQAKLVNGECVYKKNDEGVLVRFNPSLKKSFLYDNSEIAGTKSSTYMYTKNPDTMKEFYASYLMLFKNAKDPLFSESDLYLVKMLYGQGKNLQQCVSIWNTESVTSLTASSTDETSDVYVDSDGKNCVFISTISDDYIYFNYKDEVNDFVLGNQKPIHDKLFSRQKITSELQQKVGSGNLDCETSVSSTYLPSCQFINKHGQYQMNYFHSPHHRADRMPQFFYFKASVDGEDKYVYLSSDGQYAVVYETDMSSFIVVLSSDPIFKSLKDFKYPIEGYSEKLKLLFNIGEDKKFLNYQDVKVSDSNFVECANSFISKDKQASCGNNVIDSDEECSSIWRASFYHSDSFNGYTSTLAKNNICHYTEEESGKTIVYDGNTGDIKINISSDNNSIFENFSSFFDNLNSMLDPIKLNNVSYSLFDGMIHLGSISYHLPELSSPLGNEAISLNLNKGRNYFNFYLQSKTSSCTLHYYTEENIELGVNYPNFTDLLKNSISSQTFEVGGRKNFTVTLKANTNAQIYVDKISCKSESSGLSQTVDLNTFTGASIKNYISQGVNYSEAWIRNGKFYAYLDSGTEVKIGIPHNVKQIKLNYNLPDLMMMGTKFEVLDQNKHLLYSDSYNIGVQGKKAIIDLPKTVDSIMFSGDGIAFELNNIEYFK